MRITTEVISYLGIDRSSIGPNNCDNGTNNLALASSAIVCLIVVSSALAPAIDRALLTKSFRVVELWHKASIPTAKGVNKLGRSPFRGTTRWLAVLTEKLS